MANGQKRKIALLVFGPMVVETILMLLLAWMNITATRMGVPPRQQMLISVAGALAYTVSSLVAGRWVRVSVAPALMLAMVPAAVCMGLTAVWWGQFWGFVVGTMLMGTMIGHYYVPFQLNMSHVQPFRTLAWSVACYNVAWGTGGSVGPFIGGWFLDSSFTLIIAIVAVLVIAHTVLQLVARTAITHGNSLSPEKEGRGEGESLGHDASTAQNPDSAKYQPPHPASPPLGGEELWGADEPAPAHAFSSTATQRLMGWVGVFFAANLNRALFATLWPAMALARGWSTHQEAIGLMLMFVPIPIGGLLLAKLRLWLAKPYLLMAGLACGGVGFGALPFVPTWEWSVVCAVGVGIGHGVGVYHSLYYANADDETRPRSVGISESLAGASFLVGPLLFGLIAWDDGSAARTYLTGAAMIVVALIWMVWMSRRPVKG